MICVACEQPTENETKCDHCGLNPLVDGRYRVLAKLGQGANATTYKAQRISDDAIVALKELLVRRAASLKTLEMFEREAAILRQLDHPNIPHYLEDFTVETGPSVGMYIAQEFVRGEPLSSVFDDGRLPAATVISVVNEVTAVLVYLRGLSPPVVHRDIKPQNLIRAAGGRVALIDFGSVQDVLGDGGDGVPTMAGTVGYMAPEQLAGSAGPASDVYALGVTALALLVGHPPNIEDDATDWQVGLPPEMTELLRAMTAFAPENRPEARLGEPRSLLPNLVNAARDALQAQVDRADARERALVAFEGSPRPLPQDFALSEYGRGPAAVTFVGGLMFAGMVAVPGGVLLSVAAAIAGATILATAILLIRAAMLNRRIRLYQRGAVVVGRVIGVSTNVQPSNESADPYQTDLYYEFDASGQRYCARADLSSTPIDAAPGDDVVVFYDPGNPRRSAALPEFTLTRRRS